MANKFNFEEVTKRLQQAERETIVLLSNQSQNYFLSSFRKQGWDGENWKEVQRRTPDTKAYKYPKTKGLQRRTSPILVGAGFKVRGGTLRRAVSNMARTAEVSNNNGNARLRMIVDLDYAKYNNEGTNHNPKRQFVGQTAELTDMQMKKIDEIIKRVFL
ncbi:hypothetical protein UFOVP129_42 [uncultured Caudovirales phage]|uniref:Phage virion morphogenesis protein n=1 Tax=uncultured Caudovirales phage TaxID=2100421 RepID=A0A6J5L919_9CAUD|nr:hypothetical protein UFOVP129_42 [uncultured Caudovirales phage]